MKGAQTSPTDMILDIHCQKLEVYVSWRVSVRPSGTGMVKVHFLICILVLDIYCQKLEVYVGWRVSVRPSGAGLVNVHFVTSHVFW